MRDTTEDAASPQLINSSGMNNPAAGGGLTAVILAGLTVGVIQSIRRLKGFVVKRR